MALKELGFLRFFKNLKNLKSPKFSFFFNFLVKFYTNHILIVSCVLCYILQKCSERE